MNAEQQDQDRRHQRAAANAGHSDKEADTEAAQHVEQIDVTDRIHDCVNVGIM
jgi:hypothetical protein